MHNKKILQIAISAIFALAFVQFYLKEKESAIANAYGMMEVLVAARDIPPRSEMVERYLRTEKIPAKYVAPGAIVVKIPADALNKVRGKVTIAATPEGSQIVQSNLAAPSGKTTGIAPLIPPGKRGYLLRLGNVDVANLILPGDFIDIMATFSTKQGNVNSKATVTILQNIMVVAVGRELKRDNQDVTSKEAAKESLVLTLALAPIEAQSLALAQSETGGEISVVVRPHGDSDIQMVPGVTPGNLFGTQQQPPPRAAPPRRK